MAESLVKPMLHSDRQTWLRVVLLKAQINPDKGDLSLAIFQGVTTSKMVTLVAVASLIFG